MANKKGLILEICAKCSDLFSATLLKDGKVLKGKHIQKMNSFIYVLSGRMQNYIRNK